MDDNNFKGLDSLAEYLALKVSHVSVIDPLAEEYGGDENITFSTIYGDHPITRNFMLRTIYSNAHEVNAQDSYENGWEVSELIEVATGGWLPLSKKNGDDKFNFIKGKSGSGKSTLLDLIMGFLDPEQGQIFCDEKNLKSFRRNCNKLGF